MTAKNPISAFFILSLLFYIIICPLSQGYSYAQKRRRKDLLEDYDKITKKYVKFSSNFHMPICYLTTTDRRAKPYRILDFQKR